MQVLESDIFITLLNIFIFIIKNDNGSWWGSEKDYVRMK